MERWILFLGGNGFGPAILFWGGIAAIMLLAFGLGKTTLTPLTTAQWFLLCIGLIESPVFSIAAFVGYLLVVGLRGRYLEKVPREDTFNVVQILIGVWTVVVVQVAVSALFNGFFGQPDMQITGNGSDENTLIWYIDRSLGMMPQAWVISVSKLVFQGAILLWALWFAFASIAWGKWIFESVGRGGYWRTIVRKSSEKN